MYNDLRIYHMQYRQCKSYRTNSHCLLIRILVLVPDHGRTVVRTILAPRTQSNMYKPNSLGRQPADDK
jgi:hypothetical protein